MKPYHKLATGLLLLAAGWMIEAADKVDSKNLATGQAAFADARSSKPGQFHKLTPADLPKPFATTSVANFPRVVARPQGAMPQAPAGFKVDLYASNLNSPREIRTAPNGDFFVAESNDGDIKVFRGLDKPQQTSIFATGLRRPYGIAFYPAGDNPQWVYVGNTDSLVRFPYKNGDLKASGT